MNQNTTPDLQDELLADTSGKRRAQLLSQLQDMEATCLAAQRRLNDRDGYKRAVAASAAVSAAVAIVRAARGPDTRN